MTPSRAKPARSNTQLGRLIADPDVRLHAVDAVRERVLGHRVHGSRRDAAPARVDDEKPVPDLDGVAHGVEVVHRRAAEDPRRRDDVLDHVRASRPCARMPGRRSRSITRSSSAPTGGSPASPPIAGSRNAGARMWMSASRGSRSGSSTRSSIRKRVRRGGRRPGRGHCEHLGQVLVAAAAEADEDQLRVELARARERVRRLERRDDPLGAREVAERGERLLVGRADVLGAAGVAQAARARGRRPDSRARPRSSARRRSGRPRRRAPTSARRGARRAGRCRGDAAPAASTPTSRTSASSTKPCEHADRVRAAADARDHRPRAAGPRASRNCSRASRPITRLQLAHDLRDTAQGRRTSRSGSASSRRS